MRCRNCGYNLDDEFRYCPRCGAPSSLAWPAAGGPWLRRPAAVASLALLLIVWLAALQKQLWISGRSPAGSRSHPVTQIAARPPATLPAAGQGSGSLPMPPASVLTSHPGQSRQLSSRGRLVEHRNVAAPRVTSVPRIAGARHRIVRRLRQTPAAGAAVAGSRQILLASLPDSWPRYPVNAMAPAHQRGHYARLRSHRPAADPWSRAPVLVKSHTRCLGESVVDSSNLIVNISARPYGATTHVYLNGATWLGNVPLRAQFPHPGRYRLFFFTPAMGPRGRVYKTIDVTGRGRQWVSVTMGPSREFARLSNDER
jgi:zinc ribbon protein